jgi:catechol 2,3-dioxygenase-like lactoylglutathione lyase family enzyme
MASVQRIYTRDIPATRRWYSALLGLEPAENLHGLCYDFGAHSLELSPGGDKGIFGLMVPSIKDARQRFKQQGIQLNEVLGRMGNHEEGESASFRDPAGNQVMVLDQSNLPAR